MGKFQRKKNIYIHPEDSINHPNTDKNKVVYMTPFIFSEVSEGSFLTLGVMFYPVESVMKLFCDEKEFTHTNKNTNIVSSKIS